MSYLYENYVDEKLSPEGLLQDIKFRVPENFNFAYDVVDELAKKSPDRLAMLWCNDEGEDAGSPLKISAVCPTRPQTFFVTPELKKATWSCSF